MYEMHGVYGVRSVQIYDFSNQNTRHSHHATSHEKMGLLLCRPNQVFQVVHYVLNITVPLKPGRSEPRVDIEKIIKINWFNR